MLRELLDCSIINITKHDPGPINPFREVTSRVGKPTDRKSGMAQDSEIVGKLLDHRPQSPRVHMRTA